MAIHFFKPWKKEMERGGGVYQFLFSTKIGGRAAPQTPLRPWGGRRPPQTPRPGRKAPWTPLARKRAWSDWRGNMKS